MTPIRWCAGSALIMVLAGCGGARTPSQSDPTPLSSPGTAGTSTTVGTATAVTSVDGGSSMEASDAPNSAEEEASLRLLGQFVEARSASLRTCYEHRGLKKNPSLSGNVVVAFELKPDGTVATVSFAERSWKDAQPDSADVKAVEECLVEGIRAWRFPPEASQVAGPHEFAFSFRR